MTNYTCSLTELAKVAPTCIKCGWMYRHDFRLEEIMYSEDYWSVWVCSNCDPDFPRRTIIAGSRVENVTLGDIKIALAQAPFRTGLVLSGRATGVDQWGEEWAIERDLIIEPYPADWRSFGRGAGPIRNEVMASKADALVLIWDGQSPGSKNMLKLAKAFGLEIFVYYFLEDRSEYFEGKPSAKNKNGEEIIEIKENEEMKRKSVKK